MLAGSYNFDWIDVWGGRLRKSEEKLKEIWKKLEEYVGWEYEKIGGRCVSANVVALEVTRISENLRIMRSLGNFKDTLWDIWGTFAYIRSK